MKKHILFYLLFLSPVFIFTNATNIPLEKKRLIEVPTRPRAPMLIPLTVDLSTTELYLNFTSTVGIATITVTYSNGSAIYQESINTDTNNVLYIPIDSWESGDYSIEVSYGSITLTGSFGLD